MKERLESQLCALVGEHAAWLTSEDWAEVCDRVRAGYFEPTDEMAEFRAHLQERMGDG